MGHVAFRIEPAVKAHFRPLASRDGLELGHAAKAHDVGPEPVRNLEVPHVEDHMVDAARRLGLAQGRGSVVGHGSSMIVELRSTARLPGTARALYGTWPRIAPEGRSRGAIFARRFSRARNGRPTEWRWCRGASPRSSGSRRPTP